MTEHLNRPVEANESDLTHELHEKKIVPPPAWKPGVTWDGDLGEVVTQPSSQPLAHWDDIMRVWGYDPEVFEIVEPVKVSTWDVQTGDGTERLWSYRAGIKVKDTRNSISYDDLVREIKRHRPLKPENHPDGDDWFVVNLGDWQLGKADGDGVKGTVLRIVDMINNVETRIRELRKIGRPLANLLIVGGGDMIEGCDGNYAAQSFTVELNRREQIRVCRRLIRDAVAKWSKLFKNVVVTAVPGNHGENRKDGKMYTTIGDNDDVAVFEIVAEVLAENPDAYGHVKFHLPENEIYVTFDLAGTVVGFTHGHITKGGGTPQSKLKNWWEEQSFGNQPIGHADILVSFHYHHFSVIEYGKKIHIQAPAMDGGSGWWKDLSGAESRSGTLTFVVSSKGYHDLEII